MTLTALKEWDVQAQALTTGQTAVILRKGGIMETHGGFEVQHREFLLYPTFLHQNAAEVRSEFSGLLRPDPAPGQIVVPARAEVLGVYKIEALDKALALEEVQALNASAIERRFHYRNRPWLHAVVLRVWPLTPPLRIEETPELLGCVSWVPLADFSVGTLSFETAAPALAESALTEIRAEVARRLS
ncbi:DUF1802 family protein [Deinococcus detaillensis]|uniref:DUF1802 family protein n=1 Tax=Deinococcus detaillensis TaxID=2592048 RepID=A0A553V6W8_9DEIO|nr:DUF1802 family protein [Deinococcus detaillensis]TSA87941.1 DUF1802 family protein [Deinococcus detaillensis]